MLSVVLIFSSVGNTHASGVDDEEVIAFFHSVENAFRKKRIPEIMQHIQKDFSYIMTYSTDGDFNYLESDADKYRANVGSFFKSKPEIYEYIINVDDIQRSGDDIMVLARIKSVVQVDGVINSCDASSNYLINYVDGKFLIKDVRGDATCYNAKVNERK